VSRFVSSLVLGAAMPAYLPTFNLLSDMWDSPNTPAANLPDSTNVPMQLYVPSKGLIDVQPDYIPWYVPPVYLRMLSVDAAAWASSWIIECPKASGRWYRARWKEVIHSGFPNEYLAILVHQCDNVGAWILKDVVWP